MSRTRWGKVLKEGGKKVDASGSNATKKREKEKKIQRKKKKSKKKEKQKEKKKRDGCGLQTMLQKWPIYRTIKRSESLVKPAMEKASAVDAGADSSKPMGREKSISSSSAMSDQDLPEEVKE